MFAWSSWLLDAYLLSRVLSDEYSSICAGVACSRRPVLTPVLDFATETSWLGGLRVRPAGQGEQNYAHSKFTDRRIGYLNSVPPQF